ncbi:unnamed protein product [Cochlearia groenlandica]
MEVKEDKNSSLQNMKHDVTHQNIKEEEEEEEEEDEEILKKRISSHPLYGLLLRSHLTCVKICSGDFDSPEINNTADNLDLTKLSLDSQETTSTSELDQFMEAYCSTLRELKEAMEKPLVETQRFVDAVYTQLNDIVMSSSPP